MGELGPVGGHGVFAGDRPNGNDVFIGAAVTHDPHTFYGKQHGEGLPEFAVISGFANLFLEYRIYFPKDIQALSGDLADNPDGQPGSGKRLSPNQIVIQPQRFSQLADFIFKQIL